ncbi:hypothetical protein NGM07_10620 [Halorussus vallis]|nr:HalOD1 output domain-containing protein [Halorussus vallis]USZ73910.1 hypothetical protein NGM07_10620 [Halorussus vallis]
MFDSYAPDEFSDDETYATEFDPRTRPASQAVVDAVAEYRGVGTTDLDLLHEAVHPDGLDRLFRPKHDGTSRGGGRVGFEYADCRVVVESAGTIRVRPLD